MSKLTQNQWIGVTVALVVVFIFFTFGQFFYSFFAQDFMTNNMGDKQNAAVAKAIAGAENTSKLVVTDIVEGTGELATSGKYVTVHYTGTLLNGQKFDSSVDRGEPFEFTLGIGQVIKGWDLGVEGMKVGGKRHLIIPAQLAYGAQEIPGLIPANSVLVFDVELLGVK